MLKAELALGKEEWQKLATQVEDTCRGFVVLCRLGDDREGAKEELVNWVKPLLDEAAELTRGVVVPETGKPDSPRASLELRLPELRGESLGVFCVTCHLVNLTAEIMCFGANEGSLRGPGAIIHAAPFVRKHLIQFLRQFLSRLEGDYTPYDGFELPEVDEADRE